MPPNNVPQNQQQMPTGVPVSADYGVVQPGITGGMPGQNIQGNIPQPGFTPGMAGQPGATVSNTTDNEKSSGAKPAPKANSTQNSLLFSELRDGMIIMSDGSFRAVVACKSINFDLMSNRERDGVELSYQDFLNALYFPIQIFVRSQRVDIGPYIDRLDEMRRNQDNMLLGVLMDDYINFIDILSQEANIMDKSFFVVVPYFPAGDITNVTEQTKGFFSAIFGKKKEAVTRIDKVTYEKGREEIKNRVDSVISGLMRVGVQAVQLNTKQLGELYYNVYNPDTAVREPLGNFDNVASLYVRKGEGQNPYAQGGMI